ncbi:Flavanone-3-hydroxylase [Rhynchospora pubera]|uniref:Flavanone-3-hydroxylase n=1 Tax=Rhynchospora pubera TaxID=906938 RepID=A0AAV8E8Y8_9POAL|nr:Flavanone-3-hydroxylase [Rhynchospora pubera]
MAPGTPFLPTISDEKTLRASFVRDEDERPKVAYNQFSNDIPVISLEGIDDQEGGRRAEICKKIVEACEDWGIFQVVDHGVDTTLVSEMTCHAREFFALPPEEKLRFDMTGGKKGGFIVSSHLQFLSNGRFRNADHQAVVNSNTSRLSIATFQNPAPNAIVYPLAIREGEKPIMEESITFAEMYKRKMARDLELARQKKLAKIEKQVAEVAAVDKPKSLTEILA